MVHLTHDPTGADTFRRNYDASLKTGLLAGRALDAAVRGQVAHALLETHRSATTTIEDL